MGADLYIYNEDNDKVQAVLHKEFDEIVKKRDKLAAKHGVRSRFDPNTWACTWDVPAIQALQDKLDEVMDKMHGSNPYYFRDSYNDSSVLWQLGLSWWQDVTPLQNKTNSRISVRNCKKLKAMIMKAGPVFYRNMENMKNPNDRQYYEEKYVRLMEFIDRGIANGGIEASL